jgi:transposase-like protein
MLCLYFMGLNLSNRQIAAELEMNENTIQEMTTTLRSGVVAQEARDEDGDGFCEVHVNTMEGFWSLLRSWLRPHRGVSQERLPDYVGFFQFVHNVRQRGNSLLRSLVEALVAVSPIAG